MDNKLTLLSEVSEKGQRMKWKWTAFPLCFFCWIWSGLQKCLGCKMLQSLMEEVAVVLNGQIGLLCKPHELDM